MTCNVTMEQMKNYLILLLTLSTHANAQIASASFFPSVKSLNPGISHLRTSGFLAYDKSISNVEKQHDVTASSIQDGIQTAVEIDKTTFFRAGKGGGLTVEFLIDNEEAQKSEEIKSSTLGDRTINTVATSSYKGGTVDLGWIGIQTGSADYDYLYKFNIGSVPNITARDLDWSFSFKVLKVGTAFSFGKIDIGAFIFNQSSTGSLSYTFYDPTTGNAGSSEDFALATKTKGYGIGVGYTSQIIHIEASLEKINEQSLDQPTDILVDIETQPLSSRLSLVGEVKFSQFAIGMRFRQVKGNFTDLEDIIMAKLIYEEMSASDSRTELTFNFSFGSQKGFTYSAFYSTSEIKTEEESDIFDNDILYDALTKTTAYGINLSYIY
ncbi:MAG: hypothetical protein ACI9QD_000473 [Thermoproteota archaeon]|jgi:hypothetical protein